MAFSTLHCCAYQKWCLTTRKCSMSITSLKSSTSNDVKTQVNFSILPPISSTPHSVVILLSGWITCRLNSLGWFLNWIYLISYWWWIKKRIIWRREEASQHCLWAAHQSSSPSHGCMLYSFILLILVKVFKAFVIENAFDLTNISQTDSLLKLEVNFKI